MGNGRGNVYAHTVIQVFCMWWHKIQVHQTAITIQVSMLHVVCPIHKDSLHSEATSPSLSKWGKPHVWNGHCTYFLRSILYVVLSWHNNAVHRIDNTVHVSFLQVVCPIHKDSLHGDAILPGYSKLGKPYVFSGQCT